MPRTKVQLSEHERQTTNISQMNVDKEVLYLLNTIKLHKFACMMYGRFSVYSGCDFQQISVSALEKRNIRNVMRITCYVCEEAGTSFRRETS